MVKEIKSLNRCVEELPILERELFNRIFLYTIGFAEMNIPESFSDRAYGYFKIGNETKEETLIRVRKQMIVRTINKYSGEQALFNELRTKKPGTDNTDRERKKDEIYNKIRETEGKCDFSSPKEFTPEDLEGRIEGYGCISATNAAAYDAANDMIIFREHNPLKFSREDIDTSFDVAKIWFEKEHKKNLERVYPFIGWNCLKRAGASQDAFHMHFLLTDRIHYGDIERLKNVSRLYELENSRDYFIDLYSVHKGLGLGFETESTRVFVSLTPKKDKEVWIIARNLDDLKKPIYGTTKCFIDEVGIFSFNVAIQMPPIQKRAGWEDFPYIARIVDRGDPLKFGTDIAFMELFGTPVIGSDPFKVAETLRNYFNKFNKK
jgi:hypothetical protein